MRLGVLHLPLFSSSPALLQLLPLGKPPLDKRGVSAGRSCLSLMYQYQFLPPPPISSHYGLAKMRYIKRTLIASLLITRLCRLLTLLKSVKYISSLFQEQVSMPCQDKWEPESGFPCLVLNIIITIIILTTIIIIIIVSQDILVWRWWTPSSFLQSSSSFNEWWLLSTRLSLFGGASPPITHSTLSLSVNSIVPQLSNYLTSSFNSVSLVAIFFLLTFLNIDTNDATLQLLNWQYSNMINCMLDFAFINI